jgi:hypothetical protein
MRHIEKPKSTSPTVKNMSNLLVAVEIYSQISLNRELDGVMSSCIRQMRTLLNLHSSFPVYLVVDGHWSWEPKQEFTFIIINNKKFF